MSSNISQPNQKTFFSNLDGLRFFAFMAVYIQHSFEPWANNYHFFRHFYDRIPNFLVHLGGEGVSCFFVLSGFLITYLLIMEKERQGKIHILFFYIRRGLRIWPVYLSLAILNFTLFYLLCQKLGWPFRSYNPLYVFTFLINFDMINLLNSHNASGKSLLGAAWSVTVEEQFYLVWPLLFSLFKKSTYIYLLLSIIVISYAFRLYCQHDGVNLYFHTLSVCGDLAIGGLFGYLSFYSERFKEWFKNLGRGKIVALYVLGLIYLAYSLQVHHTVFGLPIRQGSCLFYAFIITEQNYSNNSFFKFSNFKTISKWGKYTYGLYMYHLIVIMFMQALISHFLPAVNQTNIFINIILSVIYLVISCIISYISYEYFEKWFIKRKDKFAFIQTRVIN